LQCVAVCCSVLQCVAVCCSVLQCVAVRCSVLQCVTVCFRVFGPSTCQFHVSSFWFTVEIDYRHDTTDYCKSTTEMSICIWSISHLYSHFSVWHFNLCILLTSSTVTRSVWLFPPSNLMALLRKDRALCWEFGHMCGTLHPYVICVTFLPAHSLHQQHYHAQSPAFPCIYF